MRHVQETMGSGLRFYEAQAGDSGMGTAGEIVVLQAANASVIPFPLLEFLRYLQCAVSMHTLPSGRVLFGAFELDLTTGELRSTETPDSTTAA